MITASMYVCQLILQLWDLVSTDEQHSFETGADAITKVNVNCC